MVELDSQCIGESLGIVEYLGRIIDRCIRSIFRELGVVVGDGAPVLLTVICAKLKEPVVAVLSEVVMSELGEELGLEVVPVLEGELVLGQFLQDGHGPGNRLWALHLGDDRSNLVLLGRQAHLWESELALHDVVAGIAKLVAVEVARVKALCHLGVERARTCCSHGFTWLWLV